MNLTAKLALTAVLAGVVAVAFVAAQPHPSKSNPTKEKSRPRRALAPLPFKEFETMDVTQFEKFQESLKGRVVLLNFWASWCGPCRMEMPHLEKLHQKHKSKDFVMVGICNDIDSAELMKQFKQAAEMEISYRIVYNPDSSIFRKFYASSLPTTLIFDRAGEIKREMRGYAPGIEAEFDQLIEKLLDE